MSSIYQKIYETSLDKELQVILLKLLWYNHTPQVTEPIKEFLEEYKQIKDTYWNSFADSNSFESALESYYQFSKNKCKATETLCNNLNLALEYDVIRDDVAIMMRDSFTF